MRCYQHIGFTEEAQEFIRQNAEREPVCPTCKRGGIIKRNFYKHEDLFFGDGPDLHNIPLKGGQIAKEILQIVPWSSGPMGFLCLEINGKNMFTWTEDKINEMQ